MHVCSDMKGSVATKGETAQNDGEFDAVQSDYLKLLWLSVSQKLIALKKPSKDVLMTWFGSMLVACTHRLEARMGSDRLRAMKPID